MLAKALASSSAAVEPVYIEDVFSTYLYTGNGSTQTITNGIDLAGEGGLVWVKDRSSGQNHALSDTARGVGTSKQLQSNTASAATTDTFTGFTSSGFTLDASFGIGAQNLNTVTYVSWTFRKQPKFFDVVTWTGNGASQVLSHSLNSVPGMIIVKSTGASADWWVWHRSLAGGYYLVLNSTAAGTNSFSANVFGNGTTYVDPTSTQFTVGPGINLSGGMVAYLFAHNAGGFGLSGTDNVISCGSFTANGSGVADVNLGYEPQWILFKPTSLSGSWQLLDTMRGWSVPLSGVPTSAFLYPNTSGAETSLSVADGGLSINATGFGMNANDGNHRDVTFIYIAIRRGPMKVPTTGTSVFSPVYEGSTTPAVQTSFPVDFGIWTRKDLTSDKKISSRLQGSKKMYTNYTDAEGSNDANLKWDYQNGYKVNVGASGNVDINWVMRRAPSFFDVVCYTGDGNLNTSGSVYNVTHNLTVLPELVIIKRRDSSAENWLVACALNSTQWVNGPTTGFALNRTDPAATPINFSSSSYATTTTFRPAVIGGGYSFSGNDSGGTYVTYLFATCAGVSKVGSYTGTGTTKQIDCGFTGGARFVLIKRTDSTGDWYVWDTARGIVSGNDPYLLLNSTAAEVTSTDYIDTYSAGFEISSTAPAAINANGGTYIFLAIA